jgi:acetyltransferase-like isoleucine patch superfamily enzyme
MGLAGAVLGKLDELRRCWAMRCLKAEGATVGVRPYVKGRVQVTYGCNIRIGDRARLGGGLIISCGPKGSIEIGNDVLINDYAIINSAVSVVIEDWVTIAPFCQIVDGDHGTADPARPIRQQDENYVTRPVHIGRDVWLGSHVVVLRGVTIGAGAVIGAGSIVTKDIPAGAIAVGVPARVVGWRGPAPAAQPPPPSQSS